MTKLANIAGSLILMLVSSGISVAQAETLDPTLQKIKDTGTLTIGYRSSSIPYSYLDNNQQPIGFSLDLCKLVTAKIDEKLKMKVNVKYQLVNPSNRIPLVKNGTVDMVCGSTANMIERQKEVAFSINFYIPEFRIITLKSSHINSVADLKGKTIVVTQGSNALKMAQQLDKSDNLGLKYLEAKDHAESFLLVKTGRAAAFIEDDILLAALKATSSNPDDYVLLDRSFEDSPQGIMFRNGNPVLKELIDGVLSNVMKSGEFNKIYSQWFESPIPPKGVNLNFPQSGKVKDLVKNPNDRALGQ